MREPGLLIVSAILATFSSLSILNYFHEGYQPALAWAVLFGLISILWTVFICTEEIIDAIKSHDKDTEKNVTLAKEQPAD